MSEDMWDIETIDGETVAIRVYSCLTCLDQGMCSDCGRQSLTCWKDGAIRMNEESNPKCTKTREAVYYGRKLTLRCTLRKNSHDVPDTHWDGKEQEWWVEEETG